MYNTIHWWEKTPVLVWKRQKIRDLSKSKCDLLTDWHFEPACWWGEDQSENTEDEVKRPTPWGAQHARGNRGCFAQKIFKKCRILHLDYLGVTNQVDVVKRLKLNKRRKRLPIIYHKITANKTYSTINLQMRVEFKIDEKFSWQFFSFFRWKTLWIVWWS